MSRENCDFELTNNLMQIAIDMLTPHIGEPMLSVEVAQKVFDAVGFKEKAYQGMDMPPWLIEVLNKLMGY